MSGRKGAGMSRWTGLKELALQWLTSPLIHSTLCPLKFTKRNHSEISWLCVCFWEVCSWAYKPSVMGRINRTLTFDICKRSLLFNQSSLIRDPVFSLFLHKDQVYDAVPGVMNANKKEQQRCPGNAEEGIAYLGAGRERRYG